MPRTAAGVIPAGQQFVVRGVNFGLLPESFIVTYADRYIDSTDSSTFLSVVERGDDYIVLTNRVVLSKASPHVWPYFYYPDSPPRSQIDYVLL